MAQQTPRVHFSTDDGLPASRVYESYQDSRGFLWLATEFGLSKYDGHSFTNYTVKDGLYVNDVWGLFEDSQNRIWIKCFSPELIYVQNDSLYRIESPVSLEEKTLKSIVEDWEGNCWFNYEHGLFRLDTLGVLHNLSEPDSDSSFLGQTIDGHWFMSKGTLYCLKQGKVVKQWDCPLFGEGRIITPPVLNTHGEWMLFFSKRVVQYNPATGRHHTHHLREILHETDNVELVYFMDNHQTTPHFWLGTTHGNFVLDDGLNLIESFRFLQGELFSHINQDHEGNLWFTDDGKGLYFYPATALEMQMVNYYIREEQSTAKILSYKNLGNGQWLCGTKNGTLYLLTTEGVQRKYTGFKHLGAINNLHSLRKGHLLLIETKEGMVWLPTAEFQTLLETQRDIVLNPQHQFLQSIKASFLENDSSVLVATRLGAERMVIGHNGEAVSSPLTEGRTNAICRDETGRIWMGKPNGLWVRENGATVQLSKKHEALRVSILDLCWDKKQQVLWLATDGYGVVGFKPNHQEVFTLSKTQNHIVKDVTLDKNGRLWAATPSGVNLITISSYAPLSYQVESFAKREGLVSNESNGVVAENDEVIVLGNGGLSRLHPRLKSVEPTDVMGIYITHISVNGQLRIPAQGMRFEHDANHIGFHFSSPSFLRRRELSYQYQLVGEGWANHWTSTQSSSSRFHNLEPRVYTFQVKRAAQGESAVQQVASFSFEILPKWTQTLWFKGSISALIAIILVLLIIWRMRTARQRSQLNLRISTLQAKALQAQMNPHFVFNALNAIQFMVGKKHSDDASEYLAMFAQLIRINLELSGKQWVSLEEELQGLETYLELEKMRFSGLTYFIKIDPHIQQERFKIPPLILQPFAENAILHGILPLESASGEVEIEIKQLVNKQMLEITILDNGIGLKASQRQKRKTHASKGIKLIEERLNLLFGTNSHYPWLTIEDRSPGQRGTVVTLIIPQQKAISKPSA